MTQHPAGRRAPEHGSDSNRGNCAPWACHRPLYSPPNLRLFRRLLAGESPPSFPSEYFSLGGSISRPRIFTLNFMYPPNVLHVLSWEIEKSLVLGSGVLSSLPDSWSLLFAFSQSLSNPGTAVRGFADGIKVLNQSALKLGDDPGGPDLIRGICNSPVFSGRSQRGRQRTHAGWWERQRTPVL